jgi:hypothetical protein
MLFSAGGLALRPSLPDVGKRFAHQCVCSSDLWREKETAKKLKGGKKLKKTVTLTVQKKNC